MSQAPGAEPYSPEMLERCDPGIRDVVKLLNERGFETTDSGDGTKDVGMPCRHVVAVCKPFELLAETRRIYDILVAEGYGHGILVEGTFLPANNSCVLMATWE